MDHWIEFPALGWHFALPDTLVSFSLFGATFTIKYYGLLIALGFLLAVLYATRRAPTFGIDKDRMFDVVIVCTLMGFVGARLYYILFSDNLSDYLADPLSFFRIWEGGLAIYGGIILAFLTALWMCRLRKVNTRAMFDIASLGFLIGQCIGRWGNFFNQEAYGGNTTLPWGMTGDLIQAGTYASATYDTSLPVHPTFLYESLWCLLGFVLLHLISVKCYRFKGQLFASYLIWYGCGRFIIEGLRTDSLYLGTMRVSQLVAVLTVLAGIGLLFAFRAYENRLPVTLEVTPTADGDALADEDASPAESETETETETESEPSAEESAPDAPAEGAEAQTETEKETPDVSSDH